MKRVSLLISFLVFVLFSGCEKNENEVTFDSSKIVAVGVDTKAATDRSAQSSLADNNIVFTGDDILWFNSKTREIKFKEMSSPIGVLPMYKEIQFKMGDEDLFNAITWVWDANSQIFNDLVLYYDYRTGSYFLHDSYPVHILTDLAKENKEKRSEAWAKFINQLKQERRLKE